MWISNQIGARKDTMDFFFQARVVFGHFGGIAEFFSDEICRNRGKGCFKIGNVGYQSEIDPLGVVGNWEPSVTHNHQVAVAHARDGFVESKVKYSSSFHSL